MEGRAGKTKSPALFPVFSKTSQGNQEKRLNLLHLIHLSQERGFLTAVIIFFLYVLFMPHHPESTDIKQKPESAFI
jgi:hypothetical protein